MRVGERGLPIDTTVDFVGGTPGGQVTFSATLQTSPTAAGSLTNTVSADAPAGVTETNSANNQATDVDTLTPQSDVSVTKTDGLTSIAAGQPLDLHDHGQFRRTVGDQPCSGR